MGDDVSSAHLFLYGLGVIYYRITFAVDLQYRQNGERFVDIA